VKIADVPMTIHGVIFDMDGTITEPYLNFRNIERESGLTGVDLVDYMLTAPPDERERIRKLLERFENEGAENATLNEGVTEVLDALRKRGIRTALLTRNRRQSIETVIKKFNLVFDATWSREDGPHKPAPDPIFAIAKQWNVTPQEILIVGDYKWDIQCGKNAGSKTVLLTNGEELPDWGRDADFHIQKLPELLNIIEKLDS
jgi:HAD superfamily hydrolase (TIGR01509 family)